MLSEFYLAVEEFESELRSCTDQLANFSEINQVHRLRIYDLGEDIIGFSEFMARAHINATMWQQDGAHETSNNFLPRPDWDELHAYLSGGPDLGKSTKDSIHSYLEASRHSLERMDRIWNSRAGSRSKEATRELKSAYKAYFFFIRALQDACYGVLLELAGQTAGKYSSMNRCISKRVSPVYEQVESISGYVEWFKEFKLKRDIVKEGANFSLVGPQWNVGIGFNKVTDEDGLTIDVDASGEGFRIGDLVASLEFSRAVLKRISESIPRADEASKNQDKVKRDRIMPLPINAAIVGLGRWGELLVSSVDGSDTIKFTRAVTRTPSKVEDFCGERGMALSDDLNDALSDDAVDALVIATPHSQHFEQLMATAAAGKHVYCEKPWTLDADEGRTSLKAFVDAGLKVAIGHNRRFAPNTLAMKAMLEEGTLGDPIHMDGHFHANLVPAAGLWRDNRDESPAGGMTSMGIHALDMFINLMGRVSDVNVQSKRVASAIDVDDSTLVRLNFESGCTGHLTTLSATNMLWRISAFCTGGWVEMRDQDKLEVASIADGTSTETYPGYAYPATATIGAALEAFAADIQGGPAYLVSPGEIEHATAVLAAIIRSAESGETVSIG